MIVVVVVFLLRHLVSRPWGAKYFMPKGITSGIKIKIFLISCFTAKGY